MAKTSYGWQGRALWVDLSAGAFHTLPLAEELLAANLGGRGLGGHFLLQGGIPPGDGPCDGSGDSPNDGLGAPIVIASGPLTGTGAPGTDPCHITTRSPHTGALGDASAGGRLGVELKRAGFDALVVTGRAAQACGIEIANGEARLTDARALLGLPAPDVFSRLRVALPHGALAATGPAADCEPADQGCTFATLLVDQYHMAGRCGVGRAFGLKNLKYLSVRGGGEVAIADPAGLARAREDILRLIGASPALMLLYTSFWLSAWVYWAWVIQPWESICSSTYFCLVLAASGSARGL